MGPSWCLATQEGKKFFRSVRMVGGGGVIEEAASVGVNCEVIQKELVGENLHFVMCSSGMVGGSSSRPSTTPLPKKNYVLAPTKIWESKFEQILGWWKEWGRREVCESDKGGRWGVACDCKKTEGGVYSPPSFSMVRNVCLSSLNEDQFAYSGSLSTLLLRHLFSSSSGGEDGEAAVVCLSQVEEYGKVRGGDWLIDNVCEEMFDLL